MLELKVTVTSFSDGYVSINVNEAVSLTAGPMHLHVMLTDAQYAALLEGQKEYAACASSASAPSSS